MDIKHVYKSLVENSSNFKFRIDKEGFDAFKTEIEKTYESLMDRLKIAAASLGVADFNHNSVPQIEEYFV